MRNFNKIIKNVVSNDFETLGHYIPRMHVLDLPKVELARGVGSL